VRPSLSLNRIMSKMTVILAAVLLTGCIGFLLFFLIDLETKDPQVLRVTAGDGSDVAGQMAEQLLKPGTRVEMRQPVVITQKDGTKKDGQPKSTTINSYGMLPPRLRVKWLRHQEHVQKALKKRLADLEANKDLESDEKEIAIANTSELLYQSYAQAKLLADGKVFAVPADTTDVPAPAGTLVLRAGPDEGFLDTRTNELIDDLLPGPEYRGRLTERQRDLKGHTKRVKFFEVYMIDLAEHPQIQAARSYGSAVVMSRREGRVKEFNSKPFSERQALYKRSKFIEENWKEIIAEEVKAKGLEGRAATEEAFRIRARLTSETLRFWVDPHTYLGSH